MPQMRKAPFLSVSLARASVVPATHAAGNDRRGGLGNDTVVAEPVQSPWDAAL